MTMMMHDSVDGAETDTAKIALSITHIVLFSCAKCLMIVGLEISILLSTK